MCAEYQETDKTSDDSADLSVSLLFTLYSSLFTFSLLLPVVIHHLDSEDNHTASEGNEVGE